MTKPSQTILIVEDQAGISEAEKTALLKAGYGVLTAETGEAAGDFIRADAGIDLVLMDIHLGDGVDGIETAKDILRIRELPIIFVSSSSDLETIERIESVSSYGFVAKRAGVAVLDVSIRMAFRLFAVIKREKRIKAQLEATLDALPDQLFEVGADGSIHDHHSPRTELLYTGDASIVGKAIADIHPPAVTEALMAAIAEADRDGRSTGTQFEMEVGLGKRWFEVSISRKNEPSNRPHFIMLKRDITERKQAELGLEAALGEKRLLLGEIQHRAKNSFAMLSGMIQLASTRISDAGALSVLGDLEARVRSVAELYALLYASDSFLTVRLDDYCARICSAIVGLSEGTRLSTDLGEVTIPIRQAAPVGLILTELLTNALKYAFEGRKRGSISVRLGEKKGRATLEIADDGIGFTPSGTKEGQGMGLELVASLVRQLGGSFEIVSAKPGTRCVLGFPIKKLPSPAPQGVR